MDGLNILTDPMWSDRCSPVSWAGPRRHTRPGIRFDDLPPIDVVLVSHNHYDHLDLPTLKRLAKRGTPRAIATLGNLDLVRGAGIPAVDAHFQVFQLGPDGFDDAVNELASALKERDLQPEAFVAPTAGRTIEPTKRYAGAGSPVRLETSVVHR